MRCISCDKRLTETDSTRRSINTGEYLDLCSHCLADSGYFDYAEGCGVDLKGMYPDDEGDIPNED